MTITVVKHISIHKNTIHANSIRLHWTSGQITTPPMSPESASRKERIGIHRATVALGDRTLERIRNVNQIEKTLQ